MADQLIRRDKRCQWGHVNGVRAAPNQTLAKLKAEPVSEGHQWRLISSIGSNLTYRHASTVDAFLKAELASDCQT